MVKKKKKTFYQRLQVLYVHWINFFLCNKIFILTAFFLKVSFCPRLWFQHILVLSHTIVKSLKLKWHTCQDDWHFGSESHTVLLLLVIIPVWEVTGQAGALRWYEITCPLSMHSAFTWHMEDISEDISITYNPLRLKIELLFCQHSRRCVKSIHLEKRVSKNEQYLKAGPVQIQMSRVTLHPEEVQDMDEIDFLLTSPSVPLVCLEVVPLPISW